MDRFNGAHGLAENGEKLEPIEGTIKNIRGDEIIIVDSNGLLLHQYPPI